MASFADDIRWENPNTPQLPFPGVQEGREQVKTFLSAVPDYWDTLQIEPDEFIEQGDTVVVLSHSTGKSKKTGDEVKLPWVHVWRFSGDQVKKVLVLSDTALWVEAVGSA
jgi:ketosteroid isomerase-like protein